MDYNKSLNKGITFYIKKGKKLISGTEMPLEPKITLGERITALFADNKEKTLLEIKNGKNKTFLTNVNPGTSKLSNTVYSLNSKVEPAEILLELKMI